jgi:hypothetical protein
MGRFTVRLSTAAIIHPSDWPHYTADWQRVSELDFVMRSGERSRSVKKKHERHVTKRDRAMVDFVARYRIGTEAIFQQLYFTHQDSRENVVRVVRRLEKRGLLHKVDCGARFSYVVITRRGLRLMGLPSRTPRPLTEQSLPVVLAIASYCAHQRLRRLTNQEFRELYPELWRPGLKSSNYVLVETDEGLKLTMLIADRGGAARRIRERVRRVITQRSQLPAFVSLISARRFRIVVLTGFAEQQKKIAAQIARSGFDPVEVDSALVPDLADMLTMRR